MISTETKYLYCVNDVGGEDFITTSFSYFNEYDPVPGSLNRPSGIHIFNFNQENFDITRIKYVAVDYTLDPFTSFNKRYTNSNALKVFMVKFIEQDIDRMIVTLSIVEDVKLFDLQIYKRDIKIENIINE